MMLKSSKSQVRYGIERDKARYFHGRKEEISRFKDLMVESKIKNIGSSFLVQGSPGVGKTALLEECKKIAKKSRWTIVDIGIGTLMNEIDFFYRITKNKDPKTVIQSQEINLGLWKASLTTKTREEINYVNEELVKSTPLLLVLDEAQVLGIDGVVSTENKAKVVEFLKQYHNLQSKKGFIMLFGGLGMTKDILQSFGLSRFNSEYTINLQKLEKQAERNIIEDWIKKEAKAKGNPEDWIDKISTRTYQWPRHIISYCNAIHNQLLDSKALSQENLNNVLEKGDALKKVYYEQRCTGLLIEDCEAVASAIKTLPKFFRKSEVIHFFTKEESLLKPEELFQNCLSRGIFHLNNNRLFSVPIPSFKTWLIDEYSRN